MLHQQGNQSVGVTMAHGSAGIHRPAALDRCLSDLLGSFTGIEAAAIVSYDGLPIASALPAPLDENRVAAMSAALLSLGERATEGLGRGALTEVFIGGAAGTVCLVSCGPEAVLVAVAEKSAKIGLVLHEIRHCATQVAAILAHAVEPVDTAAPETRTASAAPTPPAARTAPRVPASPLPAASRPAPPLPATPLPARTAPWSSYAPVGTVVPGESATRP